MVDRKESSEAQRKAMDARGEPPLEFNLIHATETQVYRHAVEHESARSESPKFDQPTRKRRQIIDSREGLLSPIRRSAVRLSVEEGKVDAGDRGARHDATCAAPVR